MDVMCIANNTGPTAFAQYGALAALSDEGDRFRAHMRTYCGRGREVVEEWLAGQNRLRWIRPEGAFYGFLQIDGLQNSLEFANRLVHSAKVGVAPGSAFGPTQDLASDACVRICFGQNPERLREGLGRLGAALS
jgi:aspartate/methionine/tyrosine aminotransferase